MRYADVTDRLAGLGGQKWAIHAATRALRLAGHPVIELTIGEPDVATPMSLMETAINAMQSGRIGYSNGQGEPGLTRALADRYTQRRGRVINADQVMCFPGTQTTLYAVFAALVQSGDEVLVGDPMYATYEAIIRATGAMPVPVPLHPDHDFRIQAADLESRISPATRVIFLNTPHNPTGAVLRAADIAAIGALAKAHDLWIVCDEVYEEMVFAGVAFASPLDDPSLDERVIVASSISKSHAAPGFRSGWCVGPADFVQRVLPLSETMLFGNQPFIADMTAQAVASPSTVAPGMCDRFARRAAMLQAELNGVAGLHVHRPEAGMFALIDVRATGLSGQAFATALLQETHVGVMPGESFGAALQGWVRVALTQPDDKTLEACRRIATFALARQGIAA